MNDREWQRIYTDAVRDAFVLGRSKGGDSTAKNGPTINTQIQCLQKELLNMYNLIEEAWNQGYETRMEDELHGTRTTFQDTDWKQRCMK